MKLIIIISAGGVLAENNCAYAWDYSMLLAVYYIVQSRTLKAVIWTTLKFIYAASMLGANQNTVLCLPPPKYYNQVYNGSNQQE